MNDTNYIFENIGYTVRLWRLANGFSVDEFSRQTGIPADTINMIETSQISMSLDHVFRMAAVLDMEPSDLMTSIGKPTPELRIRLLALSVESHPDPAVRRYVENLINTALDESENLDDPGNPEPSLGSTAPAPKKTAGKKPKTKKSRNP